MGFFKKIFKSIGKVFKKIGKGIKKAFVAVGKFTNKLGIVGQIGMMFAVPYLAGLAVQGLTTLGSGFMTGLANTGYITSGTKLVAAKGFTAGAARVAHTVLSTAAEIASKGMHTYRTISNTIKGVVGDIAKGIGNKMGIPTNISFVSPMTGKAIPGVEGTAGDIFENAAKRLKHGFNPPPLTDRILPLTDLSKVNPKSMNYEYGGVTKDVTSKIAPSDPSMNRPVYAPVEGATPDGNLIDIIFPADKTAKEVAEIAARKAAAAKAAAENKSLEKQVAEALVGTGITNLMAKPPTEYTYAGGPGPSSRSYVPPRNPDTYGIAGIAEFTAAHGIGIPFDGTTRADDYASLVPAPALIAAFPKNSFTDMLYNEQTSGKPPLWFPEGSLV